VNKRCYTFTLFKYQIIEVMRDKLESYFKQAMIILFICVFVLLPAYIGFTNVINH